MITWNLLLMRGDRPVVTVCAQAPRKSIRCACNGAAHATAFECQDWHRSASAAVAGGVRPRRVGSEYGVKVGNTRVATDH